MKEVPGQLSFDFDFETAAGCTEQQIAAIAEACHEVNRVYCRSIGDDSQPLWADAPQWQKDSAINGVRFHLENPDAGPEGSHENWMRVKLAEGWVYGKKKDPEAKTHHCLVPYHELPWGQRAKDHIFTQTVKALHLAYVPKAAQ